MTTHKCSGCGASGAFWRPENGRQAVIRGAVQARCETCGRVTEWLSAAQLAQRRPVGQGEPPQDRLMERGT